MNSVAVSPRVPSQPSNCDRYGHPLCDAATAIVDEALERYLSEMEDQVTERWTHLYRKLYDDRSTQVSQDDLVEVIQATLRELSQDSAGQISTYEDGRRRCVQRRICLAGWECHGYLVPSQDWKDQKDLGAVRSALKRKLLVLLDHLIA